MELSLIVDELNQITDKLQQQKVKVAYDQFNVTIGNLLISIGDLKLDEKMTKDVIKLNQVLKQCVEAMENKDNILLADLLEYEVIDILTEIYGV